MFPMFKSKRMFTVSEVTASRHRPKIFDLIPSPIKYFEKIVENTLIYFQGEAKAIQFVTHVPQVNRPYNALTCCSSKF